MGNNSFPPISVDEIRNFRKLMNSQVKSQIIENNLDRGKDSLLDGYSTHGELERICVIAYEQDTITSYRNKVQVVDVGALPYCT